jgi:Fur family ferric uptake transcriptional regulator
MGAASAERSHLASTATEVSSWRGRLRERGLRATEPRLAILQSLESLDHATPEEIFGHVLRAAPSASISSVYRGLETLAECGLVCHTHLGEGAPSYQLTERANHVHLVCETCGIVTQIDEDQAHQIATLIQTSRAFDVNLRHLSVFGVCKSCRGHC